MQHSRQTRRTQRAWALFLGCWIVLVLGGRWLSATAQRASVLAHEINDGRFFLRGAFRSYFRANIEYVEKDFNGGQKLTGKVPIGQEMYRATIPINHAPDCIGWHVDLFVSHGRLAGIRPIPPTAPPSFRFVQLWAIVQVLRSMALDLAAVLWLAGLLLIPFTGTARRALGQVWIAVAITGTLCWCTADNFAWNWTRLDLNMVGLGIGLGAMLASAIIATAPPRRGRSPLRCRCGYDLQGNESGICPECGRPTAMGIRRAISERREHFAQALSSVRDGVDEVNGASATLASITVSLRVEGTLSTSDATTLVSLEGRQRDNGGGGQDHGGSDDGPGHH